MALLRGTEEHQQPPEHPGNHTTLTCVAWRDDADSQGGCKYDQGTHQLQPHAQPLLQQARGKGVVGLAARW